MMGRAGSSSHPRLGHPYERLELANVQPRVGHSRFHLEPLEGGFAKQVLERPCGAGPPCHVARAKVADKGGFQLAHKLLLLLDLLPQLVGSLLDVHPFGRAQRGEAGAVARPLFELAFSQG